MDKPKYDSDICDSCNEKYTMIHKDQDEKYIENPFNPYRYELVTIKYEHECYINPLAAQGNWMEYSVCPDCFINKILPKLIELKLLPKKEWGGYIS